MRTYRVALVVALLLAAGTACSGHGAASQDRQTPQPPERHAYHDHPPMESLPLTLDPEQFKEDRVAYLAYAVAAQIREVLYQEPCYCPCDRQDGHHSLLDCFTSDHGARCLICRKEALLCFRLHKKKKTPGQIRDAMANGAAWRFELGKYADELYAKYLRTRK